MNTPVRIAGSGVGLLVVFGIALATGSVVGPVGEPVATEAAHPEAAHPGDRAHTDEGAGGGDTAHGEAPAGHGDAAHVPGGLMVSQDGYTLSLAGATAAAGDDVPVSFVIDGPDGRPVTDYEVVHEQQLHLIAVRRDLSGYQHVHPTMGRSGLWSTSLDLTAGAWRLYADFRPTGADALTLGTDLSVAGSYRPAPPAEPARVAHVDGYTVRVSGDAVPGAESELAFSVSKDGEPVTDLQPYLGAYGHLVALREGDLAYLHVHATEQALEQGPELVFSTSVPSEGGYRLFLDFKHEGQVRTASFALDTGEHAQPAPETAQETAQEAAQEADQEGTRAPAQRSGHTPHGDPH